MNIREATPDDAGFLAWVMLAASRSHLARGVWEYINGQDEQTALKYLEVLATTEATHWCHWSRFVIADVDGRPAAGLCGFDPRVDGMEALFTVMPEVNVATDMCIDDVPAVMERSAVVGEVALPYEHGTWVVENVATRAEYRRRGLVDALLRDVLDRGRSAGFERSQISVFIGNLPARTAYLKAGFRHRDEKRSARFEREVGCPGIERLVRPL
jgi:translation initiation factor 4G